MITDDKIYQIGVMIGNVHTQHPQELIQGIYEAASKTNVNVTLFPAAQGNAQEFWSQTSKNRSATFSYQNNALYDYAHIAKLDALIISYGTLCIYFADENRDNFISRFKDVPLIILEEYDEKSDDSFIMSDNYGSMCNIIEHLIRDHKYKKILHLAGPKNNMDANDRKKAYIDCMDLHKLPFNDDMIAYGDYSTDVDDIVEELLDKNPDAEAIVCANDEMAISVYRVCEKRGLVVGKDIAVTGYDDIEPAQRMDPPLTTANQDGMDMGYKAFMLAVSVCKDHVHKAIKLPAHFRRRSSCGCAYYSAVETSLLLESLRVVKDADDLLNIMATSSCAASQSVKSINTEESIMLCKEYFDTLIQTIYRIRNNDYSLDDKEELFRILIGALRHISDSEHLNYINITRFIHTFHQIMEHIISITESKDSIVLLGYVFTMTDEYILSSMMHYSTDKVTDLRRNNWMVPAMIQEMMENVVDIKEFYKIALRQIKSQGAKSAYIYLLKNPKKYDRITEFTCPKELYLAGEYVDDEIVSYDVKERPRISWADGLSSRYAVSAGHIYVSFILFAEEYQYGLMVCEIDSNLIADMYGTGLQISTSLAYLHMSQKELSAKKSLMDTLKTLENKNKILSFISANDQLTGLYNRRGFMERVIEETAANEGKTAVIFFSDLDHLKEINDVFGHSEGDYALIHSSEILKKVFSPIGFAGRIGGDEFVSMVVSDDPEIVDSVLASINEEITLLNSQSGKAYYIEFSTGYVKFTCSYDVPIGDIINQADEVLYRAKKNRRKSIQRALNN